MAKKYPNIQTLEVYQQGGDTQQVTPCPDATIDKDLNLDNRERSISRFNYGKANSENKCGNCIFFDISNRMKKCMNNKSGNVGYCSDQEFVCSKDNVCDSYESGGPLTRDEDSYIKQGEYSSEYEESKQTVEQIQEGLQMPGLNQPVSPPQEQMAMQQQMPQQPVQPQQAMMPEQQIPSFEYGGSLRKFQYDNDDVDGMENAETDYPGSENNNRSAEDIVNDVEAEVARQEDCTSRGGNWNTITQTCDGLDDNTDIYDAENDKENTLISKFKDWQTNRGKNRRRRTSQNVDDDFIMYNADPNSGVLGQIGNWFKSVRKDFQNYDVDPNKITKKEFRNYKRFLREQNPDLSRKEINKMAKTVFPSAGSNRWGKEHYQQFKVTNPFDETRWFDPSDPDKLLTYEQQRQNQYNQYVNKRTAMYPELYQVSSMDLDGNINYTGEKLLGDMIETEYVPDAVMIVHNEDNTGIKGSYVYDGVDASGQKKYKYIPFDAENPTNITYTPSSQKRENECFELREKCLGTNPPGEWDGANCKCIEPTSQDQNNQSVDDDANLDDMVLPDDLKFGGAIPTYAYMRDGGQLPKHQIKSIVKHGDEGITLVDDGIKSVGKLINNIKGIGTSSYFPKVTHTSKYLYDQGNERSNLIRNAKDDVEAFGKLNPGAFEFEKTMASPIFKNALHRHNYGFDLYGNHRIKDMTSIFEDYSQFSPLDVNILLSKQDDLLNDIPYLGVEPYANVFSKYNLENNKNKIGGTLEWVRQNLLSRMKTTEGRLRIKENYLGKNASEADVDKFITSFAQIPTLETRASMSGNILDNAKKQWFFNKGWESGGDRDLTTGRLPYIGMNLNIPNHYGSRIYRHENEHALDEIGSLIRDGNIASKYTTYNPLTEYATSKFNIHAPLMEKIPTFGLNKFTGQRLDFIDPKDYGALNAETRIMNNLLKTRGYQPIAGGGTHLGEAKSSIDYMTTPHVTKKGEDFKWGTLHSEPTAHVAELQQFMMEKDIIPKDDYTKVTADMIANIRKNFGSGENAIFGYDNYPLRILQTTKDTPGNNKIIANILNKMLTGTALTTAVSELEMKRDGGSLTKFQNKNEWTDDQLLKWLQLQNQIVGSPKTSTYDPANVDVTDRSTWPNTKFTYADGTYNEMYPWLPDMSTKEGRSAAYNIHKAATDKFPNYSLMPTVYWGQDANSDDGMGWNAYPYLNETVEDKQKRTGNFSDLNQVMAFANENNLSLEDVKNLTINGQPLTSIYDFGKDSEVRNAENSDISGTFYDANLNQLFDRVIQQGYDEYKKEYTPQLGTPGVNYPNLASGESWTSDGNIRKLDATYGSVIKKTPPVLNQKGELLTKDRDEMLSFEDFQNNIIANYKPNYQTITPDNYNDAIKHSLNPYFEGEMGGYGGPTMGYNTGNQFLSIGDNDSLPNPSFINRGPADPSSYEMNTLMGWIPQLVGGAGVGKWLLNKLGKQMIKTIPGSSAIGAPVTWGQGLNTFTAGHALTNTLPNAYTDFKEGNTLDGFGNLALGALELSGVGNTGLINLLPKNVSQLRTLNPTFPALNQQGTNLLNSRLSTPSTTNVGKFVDKIAGPASTNYQMPLFNINPWSKQPSQLSQLRNFRNTDFTNSLVNPLYTPQRLTTTPILDLKQTGGSLYKAQNGAEDVAAMYMVSPEQFDYEAGMPKEGAISSYGDVWQGGQWVDATEENQGFTTPDSDQFNVVGDAFSDETGIINRNVNDMFTASAVNQSMKTSAANTYDVRRRDINTDTWTPNEGAINRSYGDIWNNESGWTDQENVTPEFDITDDFAFKGDNNTLSRRQLRKVRKNKRREDKAIEAGFESYEDMQTAKQEEKELRRQRRKDRRDRWGDTFGQRMRNRLNYIKDSKAVQTYEKGAKAIVEGAKIASNIIDASNINDEQNYLNSTRSADDAYALMSADTLSRGETDENTGLMFGDDKVIARQDSYGKYGIELPKAQYGHTGWGQTNPRFGLKYTSEDNPLSLFFGADRMNCWGGSCRDSGGGKFKRGFYSELSPYKTTKQYMNYGPDGTVIPGDEYEEWTASGDLGGRLRFDQDFYSLPFAGPSGIMLEGSGGITFDGSTGGINPYYGGRAGMQFKAPVGLKLPKWNYASPDRADFMPQSQLDIYADWKNNEGLKIGADYRWGILNAGVTYNPSTSKWEYSGGIGAYFEDGGEQKETTMSIDTDMYYELLAAGADIEII